MSKVRVYEVAKELDITTKETMNLLKEYGFVIHSHMSTLEDQEIKLITEYYKKCKTSTNTNDFVTTKNDALTTT